MNQISNQSKLYNLSATLFLYSLIIVDLFRKFEGGSVTTVRNVIYFATFALLLFDMIKRKAVGRMILLAFVVLALILVSYAINVSHPQVYSATFFLFISRLWPAYYIGRYTSDWQSLGKSVLLASPIALFYSIVLFLNPEIAGGQAYATIASNLAFVTLISFHVSVKRRNLLWILIPITCLIPVFFYGTRAFFFGVLLSLMLAYLLRLRSSSSRVSVLLIVFLSGIGIAFIAFGDVIFDRLSVLFPNSRTLVMMGKGDLLDDSNRFSFYNRIITHLSEKPFSMLGLVGDRIFLSASNASVDDILSNFSHNCLLELCMDFGLLLGGLLSIYFLSLLIRSIKKSFMLFQEVHFIFVLVFGACFLDMMVSSSFMSSYHIWLLFGLAYAINSRMIQSVNS